MTHKDMTDSEMEDDKNPETLVAIYLHMCGRHYEDDIRAHPMDRSNHSVKVVL